MGWMYIFPCNVDLRYIWQMRARSWILQLHAEATVIVKIYCRLFMCTGPSRGRAGLGTIFRSGPVRNF